MATHQNGRWSAEVEDIDNIDDPLPTMIGAPGEKASFAWASSQIDAGLRAHLIRQTEQLKAWLVKQEKCRAENQASLERKLRVAISNAMADASASTEAETDASHDEVVELPGSLVDSTRDDFIERPFTGEKRPTTADNEFWLTGMGMSKPIFDGLEVLVLPDSATPNGLANQTSVPSSAAALVSHVQAALSAQVSQQNVHLEHWALRQEKRDNQAQSRIQQLLRELLRSSPNGNSDGDQIVNHIQSLKSMDSDANPKPVNLMKKQWTFARPQPDREPGSQEEEDEEEQEDEELLAFPPASEGSLFRRCFLLFDQAETYMVGRCISVFMVTIIFFSTVTFILESMPEFQERLPLCAELIQAGLPVTREACEPKPLEAFSVMEAVCIAIFTFEYLTRLCTSWTEARLADAPLNRVLVYAGFPMNVIDVLAVAPFYLGLVLGGDAVVAVRFLRLARVLRLAKLLKHHPAGVMFGEALAESRLPLAMLWFFNVISGVIFAAIVFIFEGRAYSVDPEFTANSTDELGNVIAAQFPQGVHVRPGPLGEISVTPFRSIPVALWWVFTTTTTVGYGDMAPTTTPGRCISVLCFYTGVIFLALPIGVLSSNFEEAYARYRERQQKKPAKKVLQIVEESLRPTFRRSSMFFTEHSPTQSLMEDIFRTLVDPAWSMLAKVISYAITLTICITTATMLMVSMPSFNYTPDTCDANKPTIEDCKPRPHPAFGQIETVCVIIFSVDYLLRIGTAQFVDATELGVTYPERPHEKIGRVKRTVRYALQWLNLVDLLAIAPFYLELLGMPETIGPVLRVARLIRIFRLLKSPKMRTCVDMIIDIVREALPGVVSVFGLTWGVCILFAACIYFAESSTYSVEHFTDEYPMGVYIRPTTDGHSVEPSPFKSIVHCFWWFFTTATTVGYGDDYPTTTVGRLVAVAAFYAGIVLVAVKLTIVGGKFQEHYNKWLKSVNATEEQEKGADPPIEKNVAVTRTASKSLFSKRENLSTEE